MTQAEFARRVVAMQDTLYRVSTTLLPQLCDREDAVQSAIEKALRKREHLRDPDALAPWLTRILINTCKDMLRRSARTGTVELSEFYPAPDRTEQRELYDALHALPEELRLPLVLHYLEGFPLREISRMLRVPEGTLKRRMWQGRKELREMLSEEAI